MTLHKYIYIFFTDLVIELHAFSGGQVAFCFTLQSYFPTMLFCFQSKNSMTRNISETIPRNVQVSARWNGMKIQNLKKKFEEQ